MNATTRNIRVLCVDDHGFIADGLRARLDLEPDMEFVGSVPSADGLTREVERHKPDVVLLDIEMPGPDPFDAAVDVRRRCPSTKVVVLSAHVRDHYISAAFRAGVWGYFSKNDETDVIIDGIRAAHRGEVALGPSVAERCKPCVNNATSRPASPSSRADTLSAREQEVLRLIGKGLSRAEIAEALGRSPKTVDGHRERIMAKLNIHTGPELIRYAIREGIAEV